MKEGGDICFCNFLTAKPLDGTHAVGNKQTMSQFKQTIIDRQDRSMKAKIFRLLGFLIIIDQLYLIFTGKFEKC